MGSLTRKFNVIPLFSEEDLEDPDSDNFIVLIRGGVPCPCWYCKRQHRLVCQLPVIEADKKGNCKSYAHLLSRDVF